MSKLPIIYRQATDSDLPLIFNSWLKGYYMFSEQARTMTKAVYYRVQKQRIIDILTTANIIIICNQDDESVIYGYLVYSRVNDTMVIHYAYTKYLFQKLGLMKDLLSSLVNLGSDTILITHKTSIIEPLLEKYKLVSINL